MVSMCFWRTLKVIDRISSVTMSIYFAKLGAMHTMAGVFPATATTMVSIVSM